MLSFEQKREIFHSFDLKEKAISNERLVYEYPASRQRGKILARELHPSGNGYVIGKYMSEETIKEHGYTVDARGWISIKGFSKDELNQVISEAMKSMSGGNDVAAPADERVPPIEKAPSLPANEITFTCLRNWIDLTKSISELQLLFWKNLLRREVPK